MRIAGAAKRELRQRIGEPPWVISRCAAVAVSVLGRAAHCVLPDPPHPSGGDSARLEGGDAHTAIPRLTADSTPGAERLRNRDLAVTRDLEDPFVIDAGGYGRWDAERIAAMF